MSLSTHRPNTLDRALVREARPDEYDVVGKLTHAGFGHAEPGSVEPSESRLRFLLDVAGRAQTGRVWVLEEPGSGRLVATVTTVPGGLGNTRHAGTGEAEVKLLAVHPEARKRGYGRLLLDHAVGWGLSQGLSALLLDTSDANGQAQRLYEGYGFDRDATLEIARPDDEYSFYVYRFVLPGS